MSAEVINLADRKPRTTRRPRKAGGGKADKWMPLYIGDYLGDTGHLSTVEHGAYLLLLMAQWRRGELPDDDVKLARIVGMRLDHWKKIAPTIREFFDPGEAPGTLSQKRAKAEAQAAARVTEARSEAARERWNAPPSTTKNPHGDGGGYTQANPLENQECGDANARLLQGVCTGQPQSQGEGGTEPTVVGSGAGATATPPAVKTRRGEDVDLTDPVARARHQLWTEGKAILERVDPSLPLEDVRDLLGRLVAAHGKAHSKQTGLPRAMQALRDVEVEWLAGNIQAGVKNYVNRIIHNVKGTSREAKAGNPRGETAAMKRMRELTEAPPPASDVGGPVVEGRCEEAPAGDDPLLRFADAKT